MRNKLIDRGKRKSGVSVVKWRGGEGRDKENTIGLKRKTKTE